MPRPKKPKTIQEFRDINRRTAEVARQRIQLVKLIDRMHKVAMGEEDATPASVKAAFGLIDKVLTTKTETETTVTHQHSITSETLKALKLATEKRVNGQVIDHKPIDKAEYISQDIESTECVNQEIIDKADCVTATYDNPITS